MSLASVWNVAGGGDFGNPASWTGGVPNGSAAIADFSQVDIPADASVTLNDPVTLGQLLFGDTGLGTGGSWELRADIASFPTAILTLDNGASKPIIRVNALTPIAPNFFDDAFVAHNLAGTNGFRKTGVGIATLGQGTTNTITGGIDIEQGTLRFRGAVPAQAITISNGATLDTSIDIRFAQGINVASGATANFVATSNIGNLNAAGATLNFVLPAANAMVSVNDNWAANGGAAQINVSSPNGVGYFRYRSNGGNINTASLASSPVNLDNTIMFTRTNTNGNTAIIGALSGNATSVLSGGGGGPDGGSGTGSFATYIIGGLNTNTTFAGNIDTSSAQPLTDLGGLNLTKVGTGTLTLSGTLSYQPTGNSTVNNRAGITTISGGTLKLTNNASIPGGIVHGTAGEVVSTVNIQAGATLDVSGFSGNYSTASLQQIVGAGNVVGNYTHDEGTIRPANTIGGTNPNSGAVGGTLSFANNFTWNGGTYVYDMTDNPSVGNDLISVGGNTTLTSGTVTPNFLVPPEPGTYTLLTSTGAIAGSANSIAITWPGRGTTPVPFVNGNDLQFTITEANLGTVVWRGNDVTNPTFWDVETTPNWTGATPNTFFQADLVRFDDTATGFSVAVQTTVNPTTITINNSANAYSFSGPGAIGGTTGLTKSGSGNVTMDLNNTFTGTTTLSGGGTIDIVGRNAALGKGPLVLNGITVLSSASGASITNSSMNVSGANTIQADDVVGSGSQFNIPTLTGSGTLTLASTVGNAASGNEQDGKWFVLNNTSGFTGTLNLTGPDASQQGLTVRTRHGSGGTQLGGAVVNMTNSLMANQSSQSNPLPNQPMAIGELHGDAQSRLVGFIGGTSGRPNIDWTIGALNTNSDFAGEITNPGGGNNAISHLTKVGSGTLTLTGTKSYTGNTTVSDGVLSIDTPYLSDLADVFVGSDATLDLNFGSLATIDTIDSLFFNGVSQATGTWGRIGSGANHEAAWLTGDGLLMVSTAELLNGDFDGDGDVDGRDFLLWQRNPAVGNLADWQTNYGAGSLVATVSAGSVPEPAGAVLAIACVFVMLTVRKKNQYIRQSPGTAFPGRLRIAG